MMKLLYFDSLTVFMSWLSAQLHYISSMRVLIGQLRTGTQHLNFKDRSKGGRKPLDSILMFKVLILQKYYYLSE